jgi:hypothetical protein
MPSASSSSSFTVSGEFCCGTPVRQQQAPCTFHVFTSFCQPRIPFVPQRIPGRRIGINGSCGRVGVPVRLSSVANRNTKPHRHEDLRGQLRVRVSPTAARQFNHRHPAQPRPLSLTASAGTTWSRVDAIRRRSVLRRRDEYPFGKLSGFPGRAAHPIGAGVVLTVVNIRNSSRGIAGAHAGLSRTRITAQYRQCDGRPCSEVALP